MSDEISQKSLNVLKQLFEVIEDRRQKMPPDSYTTTLFQGGIKKIASKITEESQELVEAALDFEKCNNVKKSETELQAIKKHVVDEAADLMYHFLVLLAANHLTFADLEQELARRFGISGLAEKAARKKN